MCVTCNVALHTTPLTSQFRDLVCAFHLHAPGSCSTPAGGINEKISLFSLLKKNSPMIWVLNGDGR